MKVNRNYSNTITCKNGMLASGNAEGDKDCSGFNDACKFSTQRTVLPTQSQIVIAGAGTVANSVAYHLVINGWNDVLVLEQNRYINLNERCFGSCRNTVDLCIRCIVYLASSRYFLSNKSNIPTATFTD